MSKQNYSRSHIQTSESPMKTLSIQVTNNNSMSKTQQTFIFIKSQSVATSPQTYSPKRTQQNSSLMSYANKLKIALKNQQREEEQLQQMQQQQYMRKTQEQSNVKQTMNKQKRGGSQLGEPINRIQLNSPLIQLQESPFNNQTRNITSFSKQQSIKSIERARKQENSFLKKVFKSTAQLSNHWCQSPLKFNKFRTLYGRDEQVSRTSFKIHKIDEDTSNYIEPFQKQAKINPFKLFEKESFLDTATDKMFDQPIDSIDLQKDMMLQRQLNDYQKEFTTYTQLINNSVRSQLNRTQTSFKSRSPAKNIEQHKLLDTKQLKQIFLNHLKKDESPQKSYIQEAEEEEGDDQITIPIIKTQPKKNNQLLLVKSVQNLEPPSMRLSQLSPQKFGSKGITPLQLSPSNSMIDEELLNQTKSYYFKKNTQQPRLILASQDSITQSIQNSKKLVKNQRTSDVNDERKEFLDFLKRKWKSKHQEYSDLGYMSYNYHKLQTSGSKIKGYRKLMTQDSLKNDYQNID